jgi:hypothetical protein
VLVVDALGNILAVGPKLLLFNWRVASHSVCEETEAYVISYLDRHQAQIGQTLVRLNQYKPLEDLKRLITNRQVGGLYRLFLGLPTTLVVDVLLPGRVFPWVDYYNPWTNTVHLYSDHPAISLHELGHTTDLARWRFKGTYAAARLLPFVDLYQEYHATKDAIDDLIQTGERTEELWAYRILYPAFGSYVGSYLLHPGGFVPGALLGHWVGYAKAYDRGIYYKELDASTVARQRPSQ